MSGGQNDKVAMDIMVPSTDPEKKDKDEPGDKEKKMEVKGKEVGGKDKEKEKEDEMSEEDQALKSELEMLVSRLSEPQSSLYLPALESLRTSIKTSTSSMTSVPKPLKFLRPNFGELVGLLDKWDVGKLSEERSLLCSIISVLAMTYSDTGNRDTLHYRLISGSKESPGDWGNEYCRHLASEIGEEYVEVVAQKAEGFVPGQSEKEDSSSGAGAGAADTASTLAVHTTTPTTEESTTTAAAAKEGDKPSSSSSSPEEEKKPKRPLATHSQLLSLAKELVPFFLNHNAEADAVDLLLELESIETIEEFLVDPPSTSTSAEKKDAVVENVNGKKDGEAKKVVTHPGDKEDRYRRVCQYMVSCVPLLVPPDDKAFLRTAAVIYAKNDRLPEALALAVRLRDRRLIRKYFEAPVNVTMKKQLAFFLARAQVPMSWVHCSDPDSYVPPEEDYPTSNQPDGGMDVDGQDDASPPPTLDEEILECLGNIKLSEHFKSFGKEIDLIAPKSLEDIYKSHLDHARAAPSIDSARANLAGTFVNAFVNAGFGNDKLMVDVEEGQSYIYKNKDHGMMSATASLGLSMLWDSDVGVSHIDKYSYSAEEHIKAGALLAIGILHSGVRAELDVAYALLEEHIDNKSVPLKVAAINGIALACAGSNRLDIAERLLPYVADDTNTMEVASMAALALGYVFVGSGNGDIAISIVQTMMERDEKALGDKWGRFLSLALGLIFLGKQDASEATIELLRTIEHPIGKQTEILVDICSYAGTGNVLKIQNLLHHCADHAKKSEEPKEEASAAAPAVTGAPGAPAPAAAAPAAPATTEEAKKEEAPDMMYQALSVIGIALVAMGEEVGAEMSLRQFNHLMTYGDPIIRKSVPLALGLISASNPQLGILDTLSRYSHDTDLDVAANAIFAMGLVGAGTNNARLAQMLRQLSSYYHKEANCLFVVRIAQGLVHMGKGTIGVNPFFNDRSIMSPTAVAGLLSVLVSFIDAKSFVLDKSHWMLYWIVSAMYPQFLITLDEELQEKEVTVRVGQAVNTVGLAGQRMGISGFQTHQTPVRIGTGERAEFGTNEYFPYAAVLENLVIIKKNPGYDAED